MNIGEVSAKLELPASTIRYYEKIGLLEPQPRISGKRVFNNNAIFVLQYIMLAQGAGFSIEEIKSLLAAYADDPSPAGIWRPLAAQKREAVRKKLQEPEQIDSMLSELLSCGCKSLTKCVEKGVARQASN